jgi:hypothetical protein
MLESKFQSKVVKELEAMFPDGLVFKNDARQGLPDLLILYKKMWAALECKKDAAAACQPNQNYYIDKMNKMSFAAFICPENKQEVLDELQQALTPRRSTRISKC